MKSTAFAALLVLFVSCKCDRPVRYCGPVTQKVRSSVTGVAYVTIHVVERPEQTDIEVDWDQWPSIEVGSWYCGVPMERND